MKDLRQGKFRMKEMTERPRRGQILFFMGCLLVAQVARGQTLRVAASAAYFKPSDKIFQEIYGHGYSFGGEIRIAVWKGLNLWVSGDYFSKDGRLSLTQEKTSLRIIPLCGGIAFHFLKGRYSPHLGLGVGYFQYKETSDIDTVKKADIGFVGRVGCFISITGPLFFDIQGSYSTCSVKPGELEKVDLGGWSARLGIGLQF